MRENFLKGDESVLFCSVRFLAPDLTCIVMRDLIYNMWAGASVKELNFVFHCYGLMRERWNLGYLNISE